MKAFDLTVLTVDAMSKQDFINATELLLKEALFKIQEKMLQEEAEYYREKK